MPLRPPRYGFARSCEMLYRALSPDSRALQPQPFTWLLRGASDVLLSVRVTPTMHIETREALQ